MPLYEYISRSGQSVRAVRPVDKRDDPVRIRGVIYYRVKVPSRVNVVSGRLNAVTQAKDVMKGYYKLEQKQGSRFRSEFTKDQIKKAWKDEL